MEVLNFLAGIVVATFCYLQFFPPPYHVDGISLFLLYKQSSVLFVFILSSELHPSTQVGRHTRTYACWRSCVQTQAMVAVLRLRFNQINGTVSLRNNAVRPVCRRRTSNREEDRLRGRQSVAANVHMQLDIFLVETNLTRACFLSCALCRGLFFCANSRGKLQASHFSSHTHQHVCVCN